MTGLLPSLVGLIPIIWDLLSPIIGMIPGVLQVLGKIPGAIEGGDLGQVTGAVADIPIIGGLIAPFLEVVPPMLKELQSLFRFIGSILNVTGSVDLNLITDYIAAIPVLGSSIAPLTGLVSAPFRWLQPVLGFLGLGSVSDILDRLGRLDTNSILRGLGNIPQELESGVRKPISYTTGLIRSGIGSSSRIIGDLRLSWQWFMNPENPSGYHHLVSRLNLFNAPRTQPHMRVNQPPRVGFIYDFPDPYLLSHNLIPSYYVAGGRL